MASPAPARWRPLLVIWSSTRCVRTLAVGSAKARRGGVHERPELASQSSDFGGPKCPVPRKRGQAWPNRLEATSAAVLSLTGLSRHLEMWETRRARTEPRHASAV